MFVVCHFLWLLAFRDHPVLWDVGGSVFMIAGGLLSSRWLFQASQKYRSYPVVRNLFFMLGLGSTAFVLGEIIWMIRTALLGQEIDTLDWIEIFYASQILAYITALKYVIIKNRHQLHVGRFLFDELIVLAVGLAAGWQFLIEPYVQQSSLESLELLILLRYPVGDLFLLFGMLVIFLTLKTRQNNLSLLLVLVGFHFQFAGDLLYVLPYGMEYDLTGQLIDPLWLAAVLSVGAAARLYQVEGDARVTSWLDRRFELVRLVTPYIFLFVLFLAISYRTLEPNALSVGLLIAIPLLIARQIKILIENRQLQEELEAKVTERTAQLEATLQEMEHMAYHDALTNLPNRYLFARLFKEELKRAERHERLAALYFVDVDHFKEINDTYGHRVGDEMIVEVASRMQKHLPHNTLISRQGGDEFVVLLFDIHTREEADRCGEQLIQIFRQPFVIQGEIICTTASIGGSIYPRHGTSRADLIEHADMAMYRAKRQGRNQFVPYCKEKEESLR